MSPHPRLKRSPAIRPSLRLWRARHLVIAACVGAAVLLALSVLRPSPQEDGSALVVARTIGAGERIEARDVERRPIPGAALPARGRADESIIGSRAAVRLEEGTVLTESMTSSARARGIADDERIVQVPVAVGGSLAEPGAIVDIIGESPVTAASAPASPATPRDQAVNSAPSPVSTGEGTRILCSGARVVATTTEGDTSRLLSGNKITVVELAVPADTVTLVVGAATQGALGLALSP
ncbi:MULTISPECIES: SAF domain-containing protein [Actinomyces]|uniref:Flagellar biosynthesis protein FlgA n=1 Tax=Actinomyces marmotae TaxID=2737173 RepID=A0A6M8B093_9ACTO|nr:MULTISPECIES: SAF domain-containing protein [Actinomyces]QKD80339.1 flagellar biosynthesis protein FlgA [Actinomyces marmotae]